MELFHITVQYRTVNSKIQPHDFIQTSIFTGKYHYLKLFTITNSMTYIKKIIFIANSKVLIEDE
jgi:hypothetical protein